MEILFWKRTLLVTKTQMERITSDPNTKDDVSSKEQDGIDYETERGLLDENVTAIGRQVNKLVLDSEQKTKTTSKLSHIWKKLMGESLKNLNRDKRAKKSGFSSMKPI